MDELESRVGAVEKRWEIIEEKLDLLTTALLGDPVDRTKKGILARLDAVEVAQVFLHRVLWGLSGAMFTGLITVLFKTLL